MKCPICTGVDLKIAERQGIEIDYCPDCRGIWLDRGELDKIIERSYTQSSPQPQPAPRNYPSGHGDHHDEKKHHDGHGFGHNGQHKKKTWLSELFD